MIEMAMTDAQFAAVSRRLRQNGIDLTGSEGTLTKDGVTAKYRHGAGVFRVEIIDRPDLLPLSLIEGRLQMYLEQSVALDVERAAG